VLSVLALRQLRNVSPLGVLFDSFAFFVIVVENNRPDKCSQRSVHFSCCNHADIDIVFLCILHICTPHPPFTRYFTDEELDLLLEGLKFATSLDDRISFFTAAQRLRRRERVVWSDTPLARAFTASHEWHLLHARALVQQITSAIKHRGLSAWDLAIRFGDVEVPVATAGAGAESAAVVPSLSSSVASSQMDTDMEGGGASDRSEGTSAEMLYLSMASLQKMCVAFRLGFTPADVSTVAALIASDNDAHDNSGKGGGHGASADPTVGGGSGSVGVGVEESLERAPPVSGSWRVSPARFASLFKVIQNTLGCVSWVFDLELQHRK